MTFSDVEMQNIPETGGLYFFSIFGVVLPVILSACSASLDRYGYRYGYRYRYTVDMFGSRIHIEQLLTG